MTTTSWVLLTMGDRPDALAKALASIRGQETAPAEIVVVGNGAPPGPVGGARVVELADNVGIPEGRNVGADACNGDVLFFLDDDAACADPTVATRVVELFDARPEVAAVSMRLVDPATGRSERRHVPRLRASDPDRSSDVTTFLGGACAIRRRAFRGVGGYPGEFHYAMEETDLAWRLLDRGWKIHYLATAELHHPAGSPARHGHAFVATARNRVWLAHRRLPLVLAAVYLAVWSVLMMVRAPTWRARREVVDGIREGVRRPTPRPIAPMSWHTVWRMTRLGRPPVI